MRTLLYRIRLALFFLWLAAPFTLHGGPVTAGVDVLFEQHSNLLSGKRVGLLTISAMLDAENTPTYQRFKQESGRSNWKLVALFAPEHGFWAGSHASESIKDEKDEDGLVIYSLHGDSRRPTDAMLSTIDLMCIDLPDVGVRTYTYASTIFYVMEECAKRAIPVVIADRPNPINGIVVDGPGIDPNCRSFVAYIDVPFCHGMTIAELAHFFNGEYQVGCQLHVIPMHGWKRSMSYKDTGLVWLGCSPQLPEIESALYYPMTNIIGDLCGFNIGVGYTQPFKLLGHPKVDAKRLCNHLQSLKLAGVSFFQAYYKPFFGNYKTQLCKGVRLLVTDSIKYRPFYTQIALLDAIRSYYPTAYKARLDKLTDAQWKMLTYYFGRSDIKSVLYGRKRVGQVLEEMSKKKMPVYLAKRSNYLLPEYR